MSFSTLTYCFVFLAILQSCASRKPVDPLQYAGRSVILGSGGGFSGMETEYRLLDNGQLYQRAIPNEPYKLLKAKSKKKAEKWIASFDSLSALHTSFNNPGNMYKFVVFKKDTSENRVVWGLANQLPDEKITQFYQDFLNYWVHPTGEK